MERRTVVTVCHVTELAERVDGGTGRHGHENLHTYGSGTGMVHLLPSA